MVEWERPMVIRLLPPLHIFFRNQEESHKDIGRLLAQLYFPMLSRVGDIAFRNKRDRGAISA